eukprot:jgi/Bigna1/88161/estExt_fgenesh1_pg.C_280196
MWRIGMQQMGRVAKSLRQLGYAVVDGVVEPSVAKGLKAEIQTLKSGNVMYKNATHIVSRDGNTHYLEKSQIFEWDTMHPLWEKHVDIIPTIDVLHKDTSLVDCLNEHIPGLDLESQTLKVQHNAGSGGCFPIHFDTDPGLDGRAVTAILYLNEQWEPSHGGHITLYPWPYEKVEIEPIFGRLVMFSSAHMPHRVTPSIATERQCLTVWISRSITSTVKKDEARKMEKDAVRSLIAQGDMASFKSFMHPLCRRLLAKAMLSQEWERSIVEAHDEGPAREAALMSYHNNVLVLRKIFQKVLPRLEEYINDPTAKSKLYLDKYDEEEGGEKLVWF